MQTRKFIPCRSLWFIYSSSVYTDNFEKSLFRHTHKKKQKKIFFYLPKFEFYAVF